MRRSKPLVVLERKGQRHWHSIVVMDGTLNLIAIAQSSQNI